MLAKLHENLQFQIHPINHLPYMFMHYIKYIALGCDLEANIRSTQLDLLIGFFDARV